IPSKPCKTPGTGRGGTLWRRTWSSPGHVRSMPGTCRPVRRLARIEGFPLRIDVMPWRAPLTLGLILGLVLAPPVASARLLCRWPGEEMSAAACQDQSPHEAGIAADDDCCEQRVLTPLPTAKLASAPDDGIVAGPVLTELTWFETSSPAPDP